MSRDPGMNNASQQRPAPSTWESDAGGATDGESEAGSESSTRRVMHRTGQILALPLVGLIRFYQLFISPLTPPTCRYYPSCSAYALTSVRRFGPLKGTWLAVRRVLRCHPWAPGGVDHVPERTHTHRHSDHSPPPQRTKAPRDKGLS